MRVFIALIYYLCLQELADKLILQISMIRFSLHVNVFILTGGPELLKESCLSAA